MDEIQVLGEIVELRDNGVCGEGVEGVAASAAFDSSHIEEPAIDAFSSHTKPAGVLVGHKPSEKREARREASRRAGRPQALGKARGTPRTQS